MDKQRNAILVPWDFTDKAKYAFAHALKFAKLSGNEITLLNVIKKKKEEAEALVKLEEVATSLQNEFGVKPNILAKEGTIFTTINETSEEIGANLVVMGTHGVKGMQKFTGSWALKVIVESNVPFIVVQRPPEKDYEKVLFPVDFKMENKEKVTWANYLSKLYKLKVILFAAKSVAGSLNVKTKANLNFAKKYLTNHDIEYEIIMAKGSKSFSDETMDLAVNEKVDIMLIMTTPDISFSDYIFGAQEQQIIANEAGIPVMCVNPRTDLFKLGKFN